VNLLLISLTIVLYIAEMTIMDAEPENKHMVGKAVWTHITHAIKSATEISKCENETIVLA
jgi:hypothetical protein